MKELMNWYNELSDKKIEDIIEYHVIFERIHPFQDEDEPLSKPAIYRKNYCNYKVSEMLGNLFLWYNGLKEW